MKIDVISDTYIPKRAKALSKFVLDTFWEADLIIHAGDIMTIDVIGESLEM